MISYITVFEETMSNFQHIARKLLRYDKVSRTLYRIIKKLYVIAKCILEISNSDRVSR